MAQSDAAIMVFTSVLSCSISIKIFKTAKTLNSRTITVSGKLHSIYKTAFITTITYTIACALFVFTKYLEWKASNEHLIIRLEVISLVPYSFKTYFLFRESKLSIKKNIARNMGRNVGLSERKTRVFNKVLLSTKRSKRKLDDANMNQDKGGINLSVPPKPDWL